MPDNRKRFVRRGHAIVASLALASASAAMAALGNFGAAHTGDQSIAWPDAVPRAHFGAGSSYTMIAWLYQNAADAGPGEHVCFAIDGALRFAMNYDDQTVSANVTTSAGALAAVADTFTTDGTATGTLPVDTWILAALTFERAPDGATPSRVTVRLRSDAVAGPGPGGIDGYREIELVGAPGSTGVAIGPAGAAYGALDGSLHWSGLRLVHLRDHVIDDEDFHAMWDRRSPTDGYAMNNIASGGAMNGPAGCLWNAGVFAATTPLDDVVDTPLGVIAGDAVLPNNVVVFDHEAAFAPTILHVVRDTVTGADQSFVHLDVFDATAPYGSFFQARIDTMAALPDPPMVGTPGPAARRLGMERYAGLLRVISWANSRGVRPESLGGRTAPENYANGFMGARRNRQAGALNVPVYIVKVGHFGQNNFAYGPHYRIGDQAPIDSTSGPLTSFQRLWSAGRKPPTSIVVGPGTGVLLEQGGRIQLEFHPEPGSLLTDTADATMEIYSLQLGPSPQFTMTPIKSSMLDMNGTVTGAPIVVPGMTPVLTHALTGADTVVSGTEITFDASVDLSAVAVGQLALIRGLRATGHQVNKVSEIVAPSTVRFEFAWPVTPMTGNELVFTATQPEGTSVSIAANAPGDPDICRGVSIENTGSGVTVIFATSFWMTGAIGELHGPMGWAGAGYAAQFQAEFSGMHERVLELLAPDVVMSFPAEQQSDPIPDWLRAESAVTAGAPGADFVFTGGAGVNTVIEWDEFAVDPAVDALGRFGLSIRASTDIGDQPEMYARFQKANGGHYSAEGNRRQALAVLGLLSDASAAACPGDLDADGDIDFADILEIIVSWGPCSASCPADIDGDGTVGFSDILVVIVNWGPCP